MITEDKYGTKAKDSIRRYKFLPYLPILGIPLTFIYHKKFGGTGIENNTTCMLTAIIQAISLSGILIYAIYRIVV